MEAISIPLLVSITWDDFQFVSAHCQVRCFDKANALQVGLVLDCRMVSHQPELSGGRGHQLNVFYVCHFGGRELWLCAFHGSSRASKRPGEGAEPSTGFLQQRAAPPLSAKGKMNQFRA